MADDKMGNPIEKQLPGQKFSSGSITLYEIAESQGKKLGSPQSTYADAVISDRDKSILDKAIPAERIDSVLRSIGRKKSNAKPIKIERGQVLTHTPTRKKVTIIEANVGATDDGVIQHRVCVVGQKQKFIVKESNLRIE